MGVLTLKGPVNCEDLRHETVLPNRPQDKGSPTECEQEELGWDRLPKTSAPCLFERLPVVRRKTYPFCG